MLCHDGVDEKFGRAVATLQRAVIMPCNVSTCDLACHVVAIGAWRSGGCGALMVHILIGMECQCEHIADATFGLRATAHGPATWRQHTPLGIVSIWEELECCWKVGRAVDNFKTGRGKAPQRFT